MEASKSLVDEDRDGLVKGYDIPQDTAIDEGRGNITESKPSSALRPGKIYLVRRMTSIGDVESSFQWLQRRGNQALSLQDETTPPDEESDPARCSASPHHGERAVHKGHPLSDFHRELKSYDFKDHEDNVPPYLALTFDTQEFPHLSARACASGGMR